MTIHSVDPLILSIDEAVTESWVEKMLEWIEQNRGKKEKQAVDLGRESKIASIPWCFSSRELSNRVELLNAMGSKAQSDKISQGDLDTRLVNGEFCLKNKKKIAAIESNLDKPPSILVQRSVKDPIMDSLEAEVLELVGIPWAYASLSNCLIYTPNSDYRPHTDCANARHNDRVFSMLVYLTDIHDGSGNTTFTNLGIGIAPKKRRLLLWRNTVAGGGYGQRGVADCDNRTRHTASPVNEGSTKLVFQMWFHQRPPSETSSRSRVLCEDSGSCRRYFHDYHPAEFHTYSAGARDSLRTKPPLSKDYALNDPYFYHHQYAVDADMRGDFRSAVESFQAAALFSNDAAQFGNAGRAAARGGRNLMNQDPDFAVKLFEESIELFNQAITRSQDGKYDMTNPDPQGFIANNRQQIVDSQRDLVPTISTCSRYFYILDFFFYS